MFLHTTHVEARPDYRPYLRFNNGAAGEVTLVDELRGEMFEPLKDETLFATARQDDTLGTGKTGDKPQFPQPDLKTADLARVTDTPRRTIERWLQQLKAAGQIEFRGAPKTGGYHAKP